MMKINDPIEEAVLITGATGLLGSQLLKFLLKKTSGRVYILARGKSSSDIANRLYKILENFNFSYNDKFAVRNRIEFLVGDISRRNLALNKKKYKDLTSNVERIYHCAALTSFNASKSDLMSVNFDGTRNVLDFGQRCEHLKRIEHISSIYVVGKYAKVFTENHGWENQEFNNSYEYSKLMTELLIKDKIKKDIRVNVYRPGVIVGESKLGKVINPGILYHFFRLIKRGVTNVFPFDKKAIINIIPSDVVAKVIYALCNTRDDNKIYHVLAANDLILSDVMRVSFKYYSMKMGQVITPEIFSRMKLSPVERRMWAPFLPYLQFRPKLASSITRLKLKELQLDLPTIEIKFVEKLLRYYDMLS